MRQRLLFMNEWDWRRRLPAKVGLVALTVLAVCFPYPNRLIRHLGHWRNPNALIDPHAPALEPLFEELSQSVPPDAPPRETLAHVERFVHDKLPYAWDWDTWGTADYLPSVEEALQKGAEDCDGRALIAASLLTRLGHKAELVTDFAHVWVKTEHGETMGPGKTRAVVATDQGLSLSLAGLLEIPQALAHGVAVFPWPRELIILAVCWYVLLGRRTGPIAAASSLILLSCGWLLIRHGAAVYQAPKAWAQLLGLVALAAGVAATWIRPPAGERATSA